jgi:NAD(P)H-hydrate epimerase
LFALDVSDFSALKNKNTEWILTPHLGEFSRLFKIPSIEVESDKVGIAKQQASQNSSIVVLKGAPTITAIPEGKAFINSTGNPGMATVGSGDVLTGIISGLWSQGMNADDAAICGVFLHGLSGDLAKTKLGERSLTASSLLRFLPEAFQSIENK